MSSLDRLFRDVENLKQQYKGLAGGPQLALSSIENGSIDSKDADGNLKMTIGAQDDGGNTINVLAGPTPPTPVGFTVDTDYGKLIIHWSGNFDAEALAPSDWSRAEVHASQDPYFVPSRATARGSIVSAAGGEVTIGVLKGPWTIKMLAWSQAGKMSAPSAPVDVDVPGYGELVQESIDQAQTLIDEAREALEQGQADLAEKITEAETALASLRETLDNLDATTLPALRQDLDDAKGRLSEAESDLTSAFGEIASVRTSVDGKNKTTQSTSTPPAQYAGVVGDTWEVMSSMGSGGRTVSRWRWNGTVWVSILIGSESLGPVDGSKLTGEVNGSLVKPGSIYADRIVSGLSQNMVPDPGFVNSTINTARLTSAFGYGGATFAIADGVLTITTNGTATSHPNLSLSANTDLYAWAAYPSMKVVAKAQARVTSGAGQIVMVIRFKRRDGTVSASTMTGGYQSASSEWKEYVWDFTLPQDIASFSIVLQVNRTTSNGVIEFRSPFVASAVPGAVIEDGAVSPTKLAPVVRDDIAGARTAAQAAQTTADTARSEATSKSQAAESAAKTYAEAKAEAARTAAEAAAAGDATSKANAARAAAEAAAALDASTKANAARDAAIAKADAAKAAADAAQSAAGSAQSAADAAMATANGLSKVLHGTTVATGTAPDGSIWWRHQGTLSGPVIGQWNRVSGSWVSTPISSEAIANLDVGKLTVGAAEIAQIVSQKIAAAVGQFLELDVGQLTVTGQSQMADVVAQRIAAEVGEFIRLEVGQLVAGEGIMDEAVINKLFADVVVASMAQAQQFIGENAILTGAVTAPKITASEELWAKIGEFVKIRAEQLEADAIDGMVITGPNIRTAASGARVQLDPSGVRVFNAENDVRTSLSPDGNSFKGEVEADTLVVNGGAELRGASNALAQGAKLTLAAGVTDPTAPPTVQPYWNSFDVSLGTFEGIPMDPVGLAWDGTNYWTVHRDKRDTSLRARIYAYRINGTTGAGSYIGGGLPTGILWPSEMFGVTCIGSELFFFGRSRYEGMVWVTDLSGTYVRSFSSPSIGYSASNPLTYRPGIGNDGTNIVIAGCDDVGPLNLHTVNKTTGAVISSVKDSSDGTKSDVTGVYVGTADWGGTTKYAVIAKAKTQALPAFNATTGVYDSSKSFYVADGTNDTGVVWAGGKFHTLNPAGYINEYADSSTGDSTNNWWIAYRWETDADGDGTIDYYSKISPAARFTWPRRACLKAIGQPKPADVELMAGYMAKKTTAPARTDFKRNFTAYSETRALAWWDWYQDTGSAPADANTFPTATPSLLASASGTFQAKGDGSGRWGPLTFDSAGRMKGAVCAGEVLVTPTGSSGTRTGNAYVTFPAGRFNTAPTVVVSANTTVPGTTVVGVGANGATTAGFTAYVARTNNTATGIAWIATEGH